MSEFFSMGGFGFYVWSSFGATLLLVLIEVMLVKRQRSILLQRLKRMHAVKRDKDNG